MKYRMSDIKNFVETSKCRTIIQAAQKLEISQPALSESIKHLEATLGEVLFYRSRNGIQLTSGGRRYLEKAIHILNAYDNFDLKSEQNNIFGGRTIRIGCHATVAQYALPKALARLKQSAPDYKIELRHDLSRNIQAEIQRGNLDIGIVINATEIPDLVIRKLASDTVGVWGREGADTDTVFCNLNLFQTQSILKKWKHKPSKIISTESLELICELVHEKLGLGIVPEKAVKLSRYNLKNYSDLPTYRDEICLVFRPEFGKIASEKLLIEAMKNSL